ncbi:MAG: DUF5593 domain-containing protein [Nocardia sp.]|nr:DUF5593 domain-containing protein [Nocardia sp.]
MWYLVDADDPTRVIRYLPEVGLARERSLHRAIRPSSLAALANTVIRTVVESGGRHRSRIAVRGETYTVAAIPVAGPGDRPLAVQVWVAATDAPHEPPPSVDAFLWDSRQWTLMSSGAGGAVLPKGYPMLHGAWFLGRIIECEDRDKLITVALDAEPGAGWDGPMRVLSADDTHTTRVFGYFRCRSRQQLSGLLLQTERGRDPGIVLPTYRNDAAAALRPMAATNGKGPDQMNSGPAARYGNRHTSIRSGTGDRPGGPVGSRSWWCSRAD